MIEAGQFPKWDFFVQIMPEMEAEDFEKKTGWSAFDLTKVWPHGMYPLIKVGEFELNRNPDKLLHRHRAVGLQPRPTWCRASASRRTRCCRAACSRIRTRTATASASTTSRSRSTSRAPVNHYNRDGSMPFGLRTNPDAYYDEPNSFGGPVEDPSVEEPPHRYSGQVGRYEYRAEADPLLPARALFQMFDDAHKERLFNTIAVPCRALPDFIVERQLGHFDKVHADYGAGIRRRAGQFRPQRRAGQPDHQPLGRC